MKHCQTSAQKGISFPFLLRSTLNYSTPQLQPREATSTATKTGRQLVVFNSQITKHGRDGNLAAARSVFHRMPFRDVVSWTAMLTAYADNGRVSTARQVFDEMPSKNTASWNAMISAYVRHLNIFEASELFSRMPAKNVVSYAAMITGFASSGMLREAEEVYKAMPPMWRDPVASNALISGHLRSGGLEDAVRIFERMAVKDVVSWSSMVDGFCKYGQLSNAREAFEAMPERNVVSWTAMIRGYVKIGMWEDGVGLFSQMRREGVRINSTTLSVVLDACAEYGRGKEGVQIHGLVLMKGFNSDVFLGNSVITMYSRIGCMGSARRAFDSMNKKDVVSWNSIITGYVQHDAVEEAYAMFESMPERDAVSWTSMVVGVSKRGWMRESVRLFEAMPQRDDVAWTAMISGFTGNGEYEGAFRWFDRMVREGVKPNPLALSSVLSALAASVNLNQGLQVHACVVKMDLESDVAIQSSLVSMYAKCGNLGGAYRIFSGISRPNLVSLNSMITAYARHGLAKEALNLFRNMEADGCEPNQVTFLGILSACCHAGLVEEGYYYFKSMSSSYSIEPGPDHYTCMVDLLGRAGLLKEALDLINSMPCDPHSAVWGALLNASKIHFDLELARLAAQRLFELEPDNATAYAVLSNMYSLAGLKKDEVEVRMVKQSKGVRKIPGCSWLIQDNYLNQCVAA